MNRPWSAALVAASMLLVGSMAEAQSPSAARKDGWLVQMDLDSGGDSVATVDFENGDSQEVRAGQGVSLGVGGWFRPIASSPFELQALLGMKYVTTAADNADINLSRVTMQLNGVYRFPNQWFMGAGVMHHLSPKLHGGGFFESVDFEDATGFQAEVGWRWISLHYVNLSYSVPGFEDVDAGSIGLRFTWRPGL